MLALIICVIFEYFVFSQSNLTHKFYTDLQGVIITRLQNLLKLAQTPPVSKSQWLKKTVEFNASVLDFNTFVTRTEHDYHAQDNLLAELETFSRDMKLAYQNLRRLFILSPATSPELILETKILINNLVTYSQLIQDRNGVAIDQKI